MLLEKSGKRTPKLLVRCAMFLFWVQKPTRVQARFGDPPGMYPRSHIVGIHESRLLHVQEKKKRKKNKQISYHLVTSRAAVPAF